MLLNRASLSIPQRERGREGGEQVDSTQTETHVSRGRFTRKFNPLMAPHTCTTCKLFQFAAFAVKLRNFQHAMDTPRVCVCAFTLCVCVFFHSCPCPCPCPCRCPAVVLPQRVLELNPRSEPKILNLLNVMAIYIYTYMYIYT